MKVAQAKAKKPNPRVRGDLIERDGEHNDRQESRNADARRTGKRGGLWLVTLQDGRAKPLRAVLEADSAGDAKDFFVTLCGILGTEHPIKTEPTTKNHGLRLDDNGLVV